MSTETERLGQTPTQTPAQTPARPPEKSWVRKKTLEDGTLWIETSNYSGPCRRKQSRREPLSIFNFRQLSRKGYRRNPGRREEDWEKPYVDWYEPKLMFCVVGIFLLACVDAFMTLHLWRSGDIHLNAFMATLLNDDVHSYINLKLAATGVALVSLVVYKNFLLCRIFRVYQLIYALFGFFCLLVLSELLTFIGS